MIVNLSREQSRRQRLPQEHGPARTHVSLGRLGQLRAKCLEAPEVALDRSGQITLRFTAGIRAEVLPEQAVQHVAGDVEGERVLERRESREIVAGARFLELLER